jgi:hypothetical protein
MMNGIEAVSPKWAFGDTASIPFIIAS